MIVVDQIIQLTRQLYPTGRAFKMPINGVLARLHAGLALSEARAYSDLLSVIDSSLPDNSEFNEEDAELSERSLGLITNRAVSLENRKLAIKRKMAHPGNIKARQSGLYIEGQLQAAGFDVYVYENIFPDGLGGYTTKTPEELTGGVGIKTPQFGDYQWGDFQWGGSFANIVANYIDEELDSSFNLGNNLTNTFFIGGNPIGSFANVEAQRKAEFRQLILRLKPADTVAFLIINYP
jgi:hypothetical protein